MSIKIKLQVVIDAIVEATEIFTAFYDCKTNKTVYLQDAFVTGETDEELVELLENEPGRFLRFPTKYDIHEYSIMESFADSLPPGKIKSEVSAAIRGRGAFRRFKQSIRYYGVEQLWYDYQANAFHEIAEQWCKDNEVEFE